MKSGIQEFGEISDRTYIKLFTAVSAIISTAVLVFYVAIVYSEVGAATNKNKEQDNKLDSQTIILMDIRDRIIRIEAKNEK